VTDGMIGAGPLPGVPILCRSRSILQPMGAIFSRHDSRG
jgi:hypothetical protein